MKNKKLFIVDTITTYRSRYVVKAESMEHAYDEVSMINSGNPDDDFDEFSQKSLGSTIIDGRQISKLDFDIMLTDLADPKCAESGSPWMGKKMIRKVKYNK